MNNENTAVVLGINENWVFAAATLLMGLKDNLLDIHPDIVIIHDGISKRDQDLLNRILPCRFIEFDQPVPDSIRHSRGTHMKFSRLLCFDLLDEYEKVVWLDTDMLILKPIDPLFAYGDQGLAMMAHKKTMRQIYKRQCEIWASDPEFAGYDFDVLVNNTGLMIFSNKLPNAQTLKNWCFEKMTSWSDVNSSIQPVMTLMFQEFQIEVEQIPQKYNCPPSEMSEETVIIHAWGDEKFWDDLSYRPWNQYYMSWLKSGGSGPVSMFQLRNARLILRFTKLKNYFAKAFQRIGNAR